MANAPLISFTIVLATFGLVAVVFTMIVIWRVTCVRMKRDNNKTSLSNITLTELGSAHFTESKPDIKSPTISYRSETSNVSIVKPKVKPVLPRSFSGQIPVHKCSPASRQLTKMNSQIIMFNGQPHVISDQVVPTV